MEDKDQYQNLSIGLDVANGEQDHSNNNIQLPESGEHDNYCPPFVDPDLICRQLESVNLTEEETDILLKDALQLNRILKAHLSKQEGSTKKSPGISIPDGKKKKSRSSSRPRPSSTSSSISTNSSRGDLPPLDTKRGLSAAQMRMRQPQKMQQRSTSASKNMEKQSPQSSEASKATGSKTASSKKTRRSKSSESNLKEWSDRW
ncbi:uncharacterized protein LOC117104508 [Anneissia japonica]|uniref:uncharacterized protein LOC117104508 n=1 Tax=Anneissia japonica TaxID=1529436 RepID=UPI001425B164|nr:uncharacterized protein LOC117104508 [Anneissia japonica]